MQPRKDAKRDTATPKKTFFKPQAALKRSFAATDGEESVALKRARKYLDADGEHEVTASPFFGGTRQVEKTNDCIEQSVGRMMDMMETMEGVVAAGTIDSTERQVPESPPRIKTGEMSDTDDEIVFDSPTAIRCGNVLNNQQEEEIIPAAPESLLSASLEYTSNDDQFLASPPPSCPKPLPPPTRTPIIRPGMKKAYTPRPSHSPAPLPTPALSEHQNVVVHGWKAQYFNTSNPENRFTARLGNSISDRPMTPVHTPLLRRGPMKPVTLGRPVTPGTFATTPVTPLSRGRMRDVASRLVEQIEEVSPPKGRLVSLDRFRFVPRT
jgi:hypothetical protein